MKPDKYSKEYLEGKRNHAENKHVCPYPINCQEYTNWTAGWLDAQNSKSPKK